MRMVGSQVARCSQKSIFAFHKLSALRNSSNMIHTENKVIFVVQYYPIVKDKPDAILGKSVP